MPAIPGLYSCHKVGERSEVFQFETAGWLFEVCEPVEYCEPLLIVVFPVVAIPERPCDIVVTVDDGR